MIIVLSVKSNYLFCFLFFLIKFQELVIEEESLIESFNNEQNSPQSSSTVSRASSTRSTGDMIEYHRLRSLEPNKSYLHKVSNMFQSMINTLDITSVSLDEDSKYIDIPVEVKQLAKINNQLHSRKFRSRSIQRKKCQQNISIAVRIHHSMGISTLKRRYNFPVHNFSRFLARMESILPKQYQSLERAKKFRSKSFNSSKRLPMKKVKRSKSIDETARMKNHIKNISFCHPSRSLSLNLIEETHEDYLNESEQETLANQSSTLQPSRQKTFSKVRETLDCFLTKNILENGHLSLQSNQPWLNFIKANHKKLLVDNLTKKQLNFYESMFEIIITEKIYLMV